MIELHTALFIAGLVVLIIVVIVSYDRYRLSKIRGREARLREVDDDNEDGPALVPRSEFRVDPHPPQNTDQIVLSSPEEPELKPEFLPEKPDSDNLAALVEEELPEVDDGQPQMVDETVAEHAAQELQPDFDESDFPEPVVGSSGHAQAAVEEVDEVEEQLREAEQVARTPIHGVRVPELTRDSDYHDRLQIEFVARIPGKNVIKRDTALGLYRQYEFDLKKPHRIFGLTHPARVWTDLEKQPESTRFTHFGMTLQLADRAGPATESELNQFSQMVLRFSEIFGRRFKFSCSFEEAMDQARQLDEMCKKYDALAILNIVTRDVMFRGREIEQHAQELGMKLNPRRFFQKARGEGNGDHLFSMANLHGNGEFMPDAMERFTTSGLTLFMNIPCTRDPAQVFNDMVIDAKELCKRLDGKLVDQNKRGMTQKALKRIGQQIRQIAADMESDGITPGGDLALRLF